MITPHQLGSMLFDIHHHHRDGKIYYNEDELLPVLKKAGLPKPEWGLSSSLTFEKIVEVYGTNLSNYTLMLEKHDWYWRNSDSAKIRERGEKQEVLIKELATRYKSYNKIYQKYLKKYTS